MLTRSIPGGVRTLGSTKPATWVVVRSVLAERPRTLLAQHRVGPGSAVRCLDASDTGLVVETKGGRRLFLTWNDAGAVQVQLHHGEP